MTDLTTESPVMPTLIEMPPKSSFDDATEIEYRNFQPINRTHQVLDVVALEQAVTIDGRASHGREGAVHDVLRSVAYVEMLAEKLVTKNELVTIKIRSKDKSSWSFHVTNFGHQFSNALLGLPRFTIQGHQFSPMFELVRDTLESFSFELAHHSLPSREKYPVSELENEEVTPRCQAGILNTIALAIRKKANSKQFRSAIQHARQETQRAKKSMTATLVRALQKYKRVLILRLDLEYRNDGGQLPTVKQAASDLAKLLNNRRHNAIFDHLVEYVWKWVFRSNVTGDSGRT